jgi:uncharacterized protein (TIGR03067 family)
MKKIFLVSLSVAAMFAWGCSTPSDSKPAGAAPESAAPANNSASAFDGLWKGREVTPGREGPASLTIAGQALEFHGANSDDWLKGTFTVRDDATPKQFIGTVTDCGGPEYIGKKCYAIYKVEGNTMTIAGYEPGVMDFPAAFDAAGARQFVFKHE